MRFKRLSTPIALTFAAPARRMRPRWALGVLAAWLSVTIGGSLPAAADEDALLAAEDAFHASISRIDDDSFDITWRIADGYYMYRSRFGVDVDGAVSGFALGAADIPPGKVKTDEFLGDVETYTEQVVIRVPYSRDATTPADVAIAAAGQGCNEPVGVCYPPMTTALSLQLAVLDAAATTPTSTPVTITSLRSLNDLLSADAGGDDEFLAADEAFQVDMVVSDGNQLKVRFAVADGYYLYRDQTRFELLDAAASGVQLERWSMPDGKAKEDEFFGKTVVYTEDFGVTVPLSRQQGEKREIAVLAGFQGCAEKGICYPPQEKTFKLTLPALMGIGDSAAAAPLTANVPPTASVANAGQSAAEAALTGGYWRFVLAAFGIGVLLTFTPCVLPMIPILSGVIAGQGANVSKTRGGVLAGIYVLGTAVTYFAIGAVAGATGEQLQAYFQSPLAVGLLVVIFVAMALSMFGLYDLQLPSAWQSSIQTRSRGLGGGTIGGVFLLGMLAALVVGACVSPLLISVLSVAIARADPWLGGVSMFAMALGMGIFLILIGIGAGSLIPKAGVWMERVKQAFGVLLLGVAIYILGSQPQVPVLLLWAVLFIVVGVFLGATQALAANAGGWRYLTKGIGTVLLVWGVVAMLGGFAGKRDVFDPLPDAFKQGLVPVANDAGDEAVAGKPLFQRVANLRELDAAFVLARDLGKPVMLDYYADWCVDCKRMEATTFEDPQIHRILTNDFILVQVDVTDPNDPDGKALKQRFGVYGPPAILFFDADAIERADLRLYGFRSAAEFKKILDAV